MGFFKIIICGFFSCALSGCSVAQSKNDNLPSSYVLPGTNTAIVGIALDKKRFPLETVKEVVIAPGQKVIFAGPDKFLISFKNKKTPVRSLKFESKDGVIFITIPKDIFERPEFAEEYKKNKFLRFDYAININGRELDPPMIVRRED